MQNNDSYKSGRWDFILGLWENFLNNFYMLTDAGRVKLDLGIKQYIREQMRHEFAQDFNLVEHEMDHLIAHYSLGDLRSKLKERIKAIKQEVSERF